MSCLPITLLALLLLAGTSAPPATTSLQGASLLSTTSPRLDLRSKGPDRLPLPGPDLAVTNWTSNHIPNPGFEAWSDPYTPNYWSLEAPGDVYEWFAQEPPWHVNEGSYSVGLQCRAPNHHPASPYVYQSGLDTSMTNVTLDLDWYLDQNSDPLHDTFYLELQVFDGSSWWYLYYYLNGTATATNSTSRGYYVLDDPPNQWNTFSHNITRNFLAIPAFPKTIAPSLKLQSLWVYLSAGGYSNNLMRAFIDNVRLKAETTTVIGPGIRNGDFETHNWNDWIRFGDCDASDARRSPTVHGGTWSLNMSAASAGNVSYAYAYANTFARSTSVNQASLSFWWRLSYTQASLTTRAYTFVLCRNATQYLWIFYFLGYGGSAPPVNNDSSNLVLRAGQFNTTGTWVGFQRNLWQDAAAYFNSAEINTLTLYFYVESQTGGSRISLLVDDSAVVAAALNGAGFEDQGSVGSEVRGWGWLDPTFKVTSTAYAGSKAANVTLPGASTWAIQQILGLRPLNGTRETYLDAMWRLDAYTPSIDTYAYLRFTFSNGRTLGYYLAVSGTPLGTNSTWSAWFTVTGAGTTGSWVAMHRDLAHDWQAVFGSLPNTAVLLIELGARATGPRLTLLLDDLYLYDDPAPNITNVQRSPAVPYHLQAVQVTADLVDQDLNTGLLHYRISGGSWQTTTMIHQAGTAYAATIPGQPQSTLVEYYVTANDAWGLSTTALNAGAYWSYTVQVETTTTTTTTTAPPPIPGFPWIGILLACGAALSLGLLHRRRQTRLL